MELNALNLFGDPEREVGAKEQEDILLKMLMSTLLSTPLRLVVKQCPTRSIHL